MANLIKRLGHELSSLFSPSLFFLKVDLYKVVCIKCEPGFVEEKKLENNMCRSDVVWDWPSSVIFIPAYTTDS